MFGFLKVKKITIPKDNAQTVQVIESWTVEWKSYKHYYRTYADETHNAKVFLKEEDANKFIEQLKECAKFINSTVYTEKKKN